MPVLLRAAHLSEVPPGTRRVVRVRGRRVLLVNAGGTIRGERAKGFLSRGGGESYRVEVRGDQIWVATDPDPEAAPARLQSFPKRPGDVSPGS